MLKRLVLSLLVMGMLAPYIFADDSPDGITNARAAKFKLLNCNNLTFAEMQNLLAMLEAMKGWAAKTWQFEGGLKCDANGDGVEDNPGTPGLGSGGGTYSGSGFADALTQVSFWLNNMDSAELAAEQMKVGDWIYMTQDYTSADGKGDLENKNGTEPYAADHAYSKDLNPGTNKVTLGYYFGRYDSDWTYQGPGDSTYDQPMVEFTTNNTTFYFAANVTHTPIVLDIDGDGKLEASNGEWAPHTLSIKDKDKLVPFDMNADGFDELTEWVGPNDGLLVEYESGAISAKNLFGAEGGKYKDGFEKLSTLDKDGDKKLTGDELKTLKVWLDKNGNAKVDDGEISTVGSLGITEISVEHQSLVSSFVKDGKRFTMWDWCAATAEVKPVEPK